MGKVLLAPEWAVPPSLGRWLAGGLVLVGKKDVADEVLVGRVG